MPAPGTKKHVIKELLDLVKYPLTAVLAETNQGLSARKVGKQIHVWMDGKWRFVHTNYRGVLYFYA